MRTVTQEQLDRLLRQPIYSWDVSRLLGNVIDFVNFSESHLSWQHRTEIRQAEEEGNATQFDPPDEAIAESYKNRLIENAEYRFNAGLSQSVRYSGLLSYVAALELCASLFLRRCKSEIPRKPEKTSQLVHVLSYLNTTAKCGLKAQLQELQNLVYVRNCITHAAGLIENYKHGEDVRKAVASLAGISVWSDPVLGQRIRVDAGAVEKFANSALKWVVLLDKTCTEKSVLK